MSVLVYGPQVTSSSLNACQLSAGSAAERLSLGLQNLLAVESRTPGRLVRGRDDGRKPF